MMGRYRLNQAIVAVRSRTVPMAPQKSNVPPQRKTTAFVWIPAESIVRVLAEAPVVSGEIEIEWGGETLHVFQGDLEERGELIMGAAE